MRDAPVWIAGASSRRHLSAVVSVGMEPMTAARETDYCEAELAADRHEPEVRRLLSWLGAEADRLQVLASQLEDALSSVLPNEADGPVDAAITSNGKMPRTPLGQMIAGSTARIEATNYRLMNLLETVRATL